MKGVREWLYVNFRIVNSITILLDSILHWNCRDKSGHNIDKIEEIGVTLEEPETIDDKAGIQ